MSQRATRSRKQTQRPAKADDVKSKENANNVRSSSGGSDVNSAKNHDTDCTPEHLSVLSAFGERCFSRFLQNLLFLFLFFIFLFGVVSRSDAGQQRLGQQLSHAAAQEEAHLVAGSATLEKHPSRQATLRCQASVDRQVDAERRRACRIRVAHARAL